MLRHDFHPLSRAWCLFDLLGSGRNLLPATGRPINSLGASPLSPDIFIRPRAHGYGFYLREYQVFYIPLVILFSIRIFPCLLPLI